MMQARWREFAPLLCLLALAAVVPGRALRSPEDRNDGGSLGGLVRKEAAADGGAEAAQAEERSAAGASLARKLADTKPPPDVLAVQDTPFRNMLLVVHCRMPFDRDEPKVARAICAQRSRLFEGYKRFFRDVYYMTTDTCPLSQGNPHGCLADLLDGGRAGAAERDGLFYMHFDALIKPRHLGINFNKNSMYNFAEVWRCPLNAAGRQANCSVAGAPANKTWDPWQPWRALQLQGAIQELRETGVKFRALDNMTVYVGNDDLFYLPRSVFSLYVTLAKVFERHMLHHEAGGPTMRQLLNKLTYVQLRSMDCTGSCCKHLGPGDALSPQFRCGHAFNLTQAVMRDAVTSSIVMQRDAYANSSSFGRWRELLDAALA